MAVPLETKARLTNRVHPPETPGLGSLLSLAVGVVIITALSVAREVLVPITLAVLLSFMLAPVVTALRKLRLPRGLSVMLAAAVALGVVLMLGTIIGTQVASLTEDAPRYASTVEQKISTVREFATKRMSVLTNGLGQIAQSQPKPPEAKPESPPATAPEASATTAPNQDVPAKPAPASPIPVEVHNPAPGPLEVIQAYLVPVVSPLATAAIVFVVAIFIMVQQEDLRDRIIRLVGSDDLHRTTAALDDAGSRLARYYLSLVAVNTGFGVIIGAGLFFIGIPSPILWGIIAGLLRFVPYVGAFGGAVFPILLAAAVDPGWSMMVETIGLFLLVEPVLGQVIEPLIYGHSTGLSPVSVVISAIFWGWIWGPIGLLLSMPLTLCLVVIGKHVKRMEFLYVLLGDKPALSPAETLYQRMLVGDADEALEQAEALIKDRSLEGYYDEVAIPSLRLAANDSLRGVLTDEQLQGIMESICGVVVELGEVGPNEPAPQPADDGAGTVLCVSGRGALDEAVCAMLAQVLGKHGRRARVVPHGAVGRAALAELDLTGVQTIVVSYLEGANSLSKLRCLIRRLRQQAGQIRIVAGLWAPDPDAMRQPETDVSRVERLAGADVYVATLHDAVDACLGVARPVEATKQAVAA